MIANVLFMVAMIPETREYLAKRKAGELEQVTSWRDLKTAHPAMRGERRSSR